MGVAYLFLLRTLGSHPLQATWSRYFATCPANSYVIFSHTDAASSNQPPGNPASGIFTSNAGYSPASREHTFFSKSTLPQSIRVHRFDFSIVKARLLLLRAAVEQSRPYASLPGRRQTTPQWFLFLSDSCAPLLPCSEIHLYLERHGNRSFVGSDPCDDRRRWHNTSISAVDCRKSMGWGGLHRTAALRILQKVCSMLGSSSVHAISA
ncbi:MAG: hypothetical protein SGPRY_011187 [Prymnesium sp.]